MNKILLKIFLCLVLLIGFTSCSSVVPLKNDAVRINPDKVNKYNRDNNTSRPRYRNGNTLRGRVLKLLQETSANSCPETDTTTYTTRTFVMFLDSNHTDNTEIEKIPIEDVFLIGPQVNMKKNKWGNINFFETYQDPLLPRQLREVPVDSIFVDVCSTPCPCEPLNLGIPCLTCLDCPDRILDNYFFELKFSYNLYKDYDKLGEKIGTNSLPLDLVAGLRFGEGKKYAAGIMLNTGISAMNLYDTTLYSRPFISLYARYDFWRKQTKVEKGIKINLDDYIYYDTIKVATECGVDTNVVIQRTKQIPSPEVEYIIERGCWNPFIYGFVGPSIDKLSIDLFKLRCASGDCEDKLKINSSEKLGLNYSIGLPINFGLGLGLEYTISPKLDVSFDVGYRYLSYGSNAVINGFLSPINQNTNAFVFRFGVTY